MLSISKKMESILYGKVLISVEEQTSSGFFGKKTNLVLYVKNNKFNLIAKHEFIYLGDCSVLIEFSDIDTVFDWISTILAHDSLNNNFNINGVQIIGGYYSISKERIELFQYSRGVSLSFDLLRKFVSSSLMDDG
jgi:hypothetical protein